jgi:DNA-binding GntR family transcriptional regulator
MQAKSPEGEDSTRSLLNVVTAEIRRMILDGELAPGSHLPEERLAETLAVSRNPVREAIRVLTTEGLVDMLPRRGAFVASLSPHAAENLFDIRLALEPLGARLAARNRSEDNLHAMAATLLEADGLVSEEAIGEIARLNTAFHTEVFAASGNAYLLAIGTQAMQRAQWVLQKHAARRTANFVPNHQLILNAIAARDEELAEVEARRHVADARHGFRKTVQEQGA